MAKRIEWAEDILHQIEAIYRPESLVEDDELVEGLGQIIKRLQRMVAAPRQANTRRAA